MNSRNLRRLAGDHAALHNNPLPPNYLFDPTSTSDSELTALDILLAGPRATPYETGVFKLHLTIPTTYPQEPPKAFFRTKIFHPNVDDGTGAVCVETLKRDWDQKLTLRDVLVTICCLLVQPNASSALNAEAGMFLEQGDWSQFERRARMMTRLQAGVPKHLKEAVLAAQRRGEESEEMERKDSALNMGETTRTRRRGTPLPREMMETPTEGGRKANRAGTPPLPPTRAPATSRPFVRQSARDDVFGAVRLPMPHTTPIMPDDSSELLPMDQDNDSRISPVMAPIPRLSPRRQAPPAPMRDFSMTDSEAEYPPSPKKSPQKQARDTSNASIEYPPSPRKSPQKKDFDTLFKQPPRPEPSRAESSRTGAARRLQFTAAQSQTTPSILDSSSLLESNVTFELANDTEPDTSEIEASFELPKRRSAVAANRKLAQATQAARTLRRKPKMVIPEASTPLPIPVPRLAKSRKASPVTRKSTPQRPISPPSSSFVALPSAEKENRSVVLAPVEALQDKIRKSDTQVRNERLERKLWKLCGGDVARWNRGDFGGYFEVKGARW
ncbi:UBC-like protein, partial [Aureobasidium melanogenum]